MTEVVPIDRTKLLHQKRQECTSIVRSRKRKLRELFAVATTTDGVPKHSLADPDVQPLPPAEHDFLQQCDILQGKKLGENAIPTRPPFRLDFASKPTNRASPLLANNSTTLTPLKRELTPDVRHAASSLPSPAPTRPLTADKSQTLQGPANDVQIHAPHTARQTPRVSPAAPNSLPSRTSSPVLLSKLASESKPQSSGQPQNGLRTTSNDASPVVAQGTLPQGRAIEHAPTTPLATNGTAKPDTIPQQKLTFGPPAILATPQPQLPLTQPNNVQSEAKSRQQNDPRNATGKPEPHRPAQQDDRSTTAPASPKPAMPAQGQKAQYDPSTQQTLANGSAHGPASSSASTLAMQKPATPTPTIQSRPSPVPKSACASHQGPAVKKIAMSTNHRQMPSTGNSGVATSQDSTKTAMNAPPKPVNDLQQAKPNDVTRPSQAPQTHHVSLKTGPNTHAMPALTERPYEPLQLGPSENSHQRSVSEVLALPPTPLPGDVHMDSGDSLVGPITPISQSSKARPRGVQKVKGKDRSKMSMVVFGKQIGQNADKSKAIVPSKAKSSQVPSEDYFTPLFVQAFASNSKWMKPLDQILHQAHKTVSTPDSYTQLLDNHACRVLRRVYHLQHHDKWSLRQPKRCPEPTRPPSHWDVLLKEMKWMRTDFRQERKWKTAAARSMAYACADWVAASPVERKEMQVVAMIPPKEVTDIDMDMLMGDGQNDQAAESQPTPDLVPSAESESILDEEEPHQNIFETVAPSAIFALEQDDLVFPLQHSPSTDRLLEELPMYGSPLTVPKGDIVNPDFDPDAAWRKPALPLSRFVEGEIKLTSTEPPQKRSRYQHALEDEDDEDGDIVFGGSGEQHPRAQPQNPDVALFRTENKIMRDRLHAGHQFRPPNEHSMPFQTFYESRSPSQWTQSEDDELKNLVREYSYNWSLISSNLATKSIFVSGAERRTPWECFERWVMLEGLPHDMQKTQYFKLWQNRIESAQQLVRQQAQNALQQSQQQQQNPQQQPNSSNSGPVTPLPRRRQSIPLKVERRRNQKHLTMIDAMRKLAKKRETAQAKQQQAASLAAMRKAQSTEAAQPRQPTKTPREYSLMRWERDQAMAERLAERVAQHQQRQDAQRRAALQARAQQGQAAQLAAQAAAQNPQGASQLAAAQPNGNVPRPNAQSHVAVNGQARPRVPMHATPNGNTASPHPNGGLVPPMHPNGAGQVQVPIVNGQARMAMPNQQANLQLLMQAQRIQEQQRQSVQIQQQQQSQHPQPQPQQAQQHVQMHQQHQAHQANNQQQQQQLQLQQAQQANMAMQNSPPAMRAAALASLNQKNFLNNPQAQALIASMNAANGAGMSTPPTPGFNVPATAAGSPPASNPGIPQQTHQTYVSQLQLIENQLRQTQPHAPQEAIRQMARQLLQNRQNNIMQSAMNAAAGGANGQTAAANGPHQYAQLLRAQQQQQAQAAAQQQAQQQVHQQQPSIHHGTGQAPGPLSPALAQQTPQQRMQQVQQQQSAQQQRNPRGSATPTPAATK